MEILVRSLFVALGSALGGVARYLITLMIVSRGGFPFATLVVNVVGSLLIGFFGGTLARASTSVEAIRAFAVVGLCGGFTTFSTFSNDLFRLMEAGRYVSAATYVAVSFLGGLGAVSLGYLLSR